MSDLPSLGQLQDATLEALTLMRDEVSYIFSRYGTEPSDVTLTLKRLFWYMGARGQAVSFLISCGYGWDSEIILRSYYESVAKILFICFSSEDEKQSLVSEFWKGMQPINDRKVARKASHAEKMFPADSVSASVFAHLQDKRVFDLETAESKANRKRLEQKWSFSEIIETLDRQASEGKPLTGIKSLLYIYGLASHLIHADKNAMDLMHDRATREDAERRVIEASHAARIMGDQVSLMWLCADAVRRHFGGEFSNAVAMRGVFERTSELAKPYIAAFEESQAEFYSRWRSNSMPDRDHNSADSNVG